jgi:thiamine-phosphate pyrophosphorylase
MIRYAITDRSFQPGQGIRWIAASVDYIQLRDKTLDAGALAILARQILAELGDHSQLVINGRADVALATGAAGVHLTSHPDELTPAQVRDLYDSAGRPTPVISISCHTLAEVLRAHQAAADLILFGPVFEKRIAQQLIQDGSGLALLAEACRAAAGTPVLALGGVTDENTAACLAAGAAGIAAIRLFA